MEVGSMFWVGFIILIIFLLALDMFVFHKKGEVVRVKKALWLSLFWISLALIFNIGVYFFLGKDLALEFLTAYLIEKSLSVDNLFVFILIFSYFGVAPKYHHKLLFWGVLGALVLRGIFILVGVALITKFHFLIYIMGAFLVYTGIKMAFSHGTELDPENNPLVKWASKHLPMKRTSDDGKFFVRENGKLYFTPLFLVLIMIESTDVVFAVDSIPAILAISKDPFIVYTSNVFALLGLRALYFALAGIMKLFHYLHYGLSLILAFIGVKLILSDIYHIDMMYALIGVGGILAISIIASLLFPKKDSELPTPPNVEE